MAELKMLDLNMADLIATDRAHIVRDAKQVILAFPADRELIRTFWQGFLKVI